MNMNFIHLSDLHIRSDNVNNKEVIELFTKLKNYKGNLIITGDIVDDGHVKQYENALNIFKDFHGRIYMCPGNHDFGAAGNFYSRERAHRYDKYMSLNFEQGGTFTGNNLPVVNVLTENNISVMLIALDTNLETYNPFDFACGEIGDTQLNALDTILSNPNTGSMRKILFFHHHPFMHNNPFMELKDAEKLARIVYNRADAILFGHKHVMEQWENRWGVKYILSSDNSPGKNCFKEIVIDSDDLNVNLINLT